MAKLKANATRNTPELKEVDRGNTYDLYNIIDMQLHPFLRKKVKQMARGTVSNEVPHLN